MARTLKQVYAEYPMWLDIIEELQEAEPTLSSSAQLLVRLPHRRPPSFGAAVEVKPLSEYQKPDTMLFLSADKMAGAAVMPDGELVSVFKHPDAPKGAIGPILRGAIQQATYLDAFDTNDVLPNLYGRYGFRPVARVVFDPTQAPPGWAHGTPEVVLMVKDRIPADSPKARAAITSQSS